jgi:hypothetical protein
MSPIWQIIIVDPGFDGGDSWLTRPNRIRKFLRWSSLRKTRTSFALSTVLINDAGCVCMPTRLTQIQPSVPNRMSRR